MRILDLGCGTGKQIFTLAGLVAPAGSILGLDISKEAVNEVNQRAKKAKLSQVRAIAGDLDECPKLLKNSKFDLIISTYAIYYAQSVKQLLRDLKTQLNPKGQIFICCPGRGTNQEIFNLVNSVVTNPALKKLPVKDRVSESDINEIGKHYAKVKTVRLANKIQFDYPNEVLQWWQHHNSYNPQIYNDVKKQLKSHFAKKKRFILTKNVLGVHFYL